MVFDGGAFRSVGALFVRPEGAEVEHMLPPEYRNRGYATKIVGELLRIARKILELHQIRAMMDPQNAASKRVLTKNGFVYKNRSHRRRRQRRGGLLRSMVKSRAFPRECPAFMRP